MPTNLYYRNVTPDFNSMTRIASRIAYLIRDPEYEYEFDVPYDPACNEVQRTVYSEIRYLYEAGKVQNGTLEGMFRACVSLADNKSECYKFLEKTSEEKCAQLSLQCIPLRVPLHQFEEQAVRRLQNHIRQHARRIHPRYYKWVIKAVRHHKFVYDLYFSTWLLQYGQLLEEDIWSSLRR